MAKRKLDAKTVRWMSIVVVFFLIVSLVVTITVGLTNRGKTPQENAGLSVTLTQDGIAKDTLHVEDLNVTPGKQVQVKAKISCQADGNYEFTLTFIETAESPLKDFLDVTVEKGGRTVAQAPLSELLSGGTMSFRQQVFEQESFDLIIIYSMDIDVSDEAQGAEASFDVELSVTNQ
ncbi:MAG: hypothetical protein IJX81_02225 [Clostridia bacterium]|nr:hypothetical protein [Clostridia bacterium]